MFQGAIGRLASMIIGPRESLTLYVYLDAGGQAATSRVWGGLAAVGEHENSWLSSVLDDLRATNARAGRNQTELKGRALPTEQIRRVAQRIRNEDHRVLFWANCYPSAEGPDPRRIASRYLDKLRTIRADRLRLDSQAIQSRYQRDMDYLAGLKGVNRWKLMSMIAHLHWLMTELSGRQLGPQLGAVHVCVDREDLPQPAVAAGFFKRHVAASLQAVGMSVRLTGTGLRERWTEGAVTVDVNGDSSETPGLQLADILLQPVQRRLPGYASPARP